MENFSKLIVKLWVEKSHENEIIFKLQFKNEGEKSVFLDKNLIAFDKKLDENIFEIECNEKEIKYIGRLAKRQPSSEEDYCELKAKGIYTTFGVLNNSYKFLEGKHTYIIKYSSFHGHPYDKEFLEELNSNEVSVVYKN